MSILIKGMEMPKSCLECPLTDGHSASCLITEQSVYFFVDKRHNDCPLVPVPPHGKLIDADAVSLEGGPYEYDEWCKWALEQYQDAPTVIPAEEGET